MDIFIGSAHMAQVLHIREIHEKKRIMLSGENRMFIDCALSERF